MPTYTYLHFDENTTCEKGQEFEIVQSIKDDKLLKCPECDRSIKRIIAGSVGVKWKNGAPTPKHYM